MRKVSMPVSLMVALAGKLALRSGLSSSLRVCPWMAMPRVNSCSHCAINPEYFSRPNSLKQSL